MIILAHAVAGAVVGKFISNPVISVPIAFSSHFIFDMIPHAQAPSDPGYIPNRKTYFFVAVDLLATIFFLTFLKNQNLLGIEMFLPILASISPDVIDTSRYYLSFIKNSQFIINFMIEFRTKRINL